MNRSQACQTLNVNSDAEFEDIKYAYRKLALELHPDKNKIEAEDSKFKEVTAAYHFLKNNKKKTDSNQFNSDQKYTETKTKKDFTFKQRNPKWKFDKNAKTPEEDWSRFTKDFEEDKDWWKQYEKKFWQNYEAGINSFFEDEEEPEKRNTSTEFKLHTEVDPSLCIACCSCETIAPGVFVIDKLSKMNPKSRVHTQNGAASKKIMDAAETCPTKAIHVEEEDTGKRLYPF